MRLLALVAVSDLSELVRGLGLPQRLLLLLGRSICPLRSPILRDELTGLCIHLAVLRPLSIGLMRLHRMIGIGMVKCRPVEGQRLR